MNLHATEGNKADFRAMGEISNFVSGSESVCNFGLGRRGRGLAVFSGSQIGSRWFSLLASSGFRFGLVKPWANAQRLMQKNVDHNDQTRHGIWLLKYTMVFLILLIMPNFVVAQRPTTWDPRVEGDAVVSTATKQIFGKGLNYLAANQKQDGTWTGKLQVGGYKKGTDPQSPGATNGETALCLMSFLASGEDPNFGKYSKNVHRAVRALLLAQDPVTGYIGKNMYEHGFATLAMSEAYGVVDESRLRFPKDLQSKPKLAKSLELAVGCAMRGQKNNVHKAWTYGPENQKNHEGTRADTSVSGAVLMGLLGARNAGIKVPDYVIDQALDYFRTMTLEGKTAYATRMNWATPETRSAIAALVMTIGKRTHWQEFKPIPDFITMNLHYVDSQHPFYSRYYMAQALFQVDIPAWKKWHQHQLEVIGNMQQPDGSIIPESKSGFTGGYQTPAYTTSMSLLALALEFRILPVYERWPAESK